MAENAPAAFVQPASFAFDAASEAEIAMHVAKYPPGKQASLTEKKAFALMLENPSMIRRPIVEAGKTLLIGFDPDEYAQKLK